MDANAQTGRRIEGESLQDEGILGTYGRDELNDNGKLLLSFATDNNLAIMNTFSTRKGGVSYAYNGVTGSRTSDFKRIDCVLTRQAHRRRVRNVVVHPQPALPVKADSDHNMVIPTVDLGGTNRPQLRHTGEAEAAEVQPTGVADRNVAVARGREVPTQPWRANGPAKYHSTGGREGVHRSYPRRSADSAPDRETDTTYAGVA